jgi:hypothetical protein
MIWHDHIDVDSYICIESYGIVKKELAMVQSMQMKWSHCDGKLIYC